MSVIVLISRKENTYDTYNYDGRIEININKREIFE